MSLTVEPSLTLEYTFVPCLSYCKFQPSTLSASRRKCSKSPAFAVRTSPSCIESSRATSVTSLLNGDPITLLAERRSYEVKREWDEIGKKNLKGDCQIVQTRFSSTVACCKLRTSLRLIQNVTRTLNVWLDDVTHSIAWPIRRRARVVGLRIMHVEETFYFTSNCAVYCTKIGIVELFHITKE